MHQLFADIKTIVLDTIFPQSCLVCKKDGELLCNNCLVSLTQAPGQRCIACSQPSAFGLTHSRCQSPQKPTRLLSVYDYHDPAVAESIIAGKYKFLPQLFTTLTEAATSLTDFPNSLATAVIVPLPLAKSRLRWRGFNQALLISQVLAAHLNLPILEALLRIRGTKTQKDLTGQERHGNIAGAFALSGTIQIKGKTIILVDDVITTGATLLEASKVLLRNGAESVLCFTLGQD